MGYRDNCGICGESFNEDNLIDCKHCGRSFCYHCGDCGRATCSRCLEKLRAQEQGATSQEGAAAPTKRT